MVHETGATIQMKKIVDSVLDENGQIVQYSTVWTNLEDPMAFLPEGALLEMVEERDDRAYIEHPVKGWIRKYQNNLKPTLEFVEV